MKPDFYWDIETILKAVTPWTKLIFICSPNNPTGNQIPTEEDLLRILALGIPTFFDEAYYELENEVDNACPHDPEVPAHDGKPHLLEGLWVGRSSASVTCCATRHWQVTSTGCASLECQPDRHWRLPWPGWKTQPTRSVNARMSSMGANTSHAEINKMPGLQALPSEGNFVLIDASVLEKDSHSRSATDMAEKGIFIRPMSGHNMSKGFIRITIGTPDQNQSVHSDLWRIRQGNTRKHNTRE